MVLLDIEKAYNSVRLNGLLFELISLQYMKNSLIYVSTTNI